MRTLFTLLATILTFGAFAQKYAVEIGAFAIAPQEGYFDKIPGTYEAIDVNFIFRYYKDASSKEDADKILDEAKNLGFVNARIVDFDNLKQQCNVTCEYVPPKRTGKISTTVPQIEDLYPIFFNFDKYDLTPEARVELDKYVAYLKRYTDHKLQLYAHTDAKGNIESNNDLSQSRAKSATDYLVASGIDRASLSATTYGEGSPVAKNDDGYGHDLALGRRLNRRIEFKVIDNLGTVLNVTNEIKVSDYLK